MTKKLFFADEVFLDCLLYVRGLYENARCSNGGQGCGECGNKGILLIKLDRTSPVSLETFCDMQTQQCRYALSQLQSLHEKVTEVIKSSCMKVAEVEGAKEMFSPVTPDSKERPAYVVIAKWRNIQTKFFHFLKLMDKLLEDLLCRLVKKAVHVLVEYFKNAYPEKERMHLSRYQETNLEDNSRLTINEVEMSKSEKSVYIDKVLNEIKRNKEMKQGSVPAFEVNVMLKFSKESSEFAFDKNGSEYLISNIMHDNDIEEPSHPGEKIAEGETNVSEKAYKEPKDTENKQPLNDLTTDDEVKYFETFEKSSVDSDILRRRQMPLVHVAVNPPVEDFLFQIQNTLYGFEQNIAKVTPFSREPLLSILYSQLIYEHNLLLGEEIETKREESSWLELGFHLGIDEDYQANLLEIKEIITLGMNDVESYSHNFTKYTRMVEEVMVTDLEHFVAEGKWDPQDFRTILATHTDYVTQMTKMDIEKHVKIFKVISLQYQKDCLPYPEGLISTIHSMLPAIAGKRNEELLEVIRTSLKLLNKEINSVEGFVEHLTFLGRVSSEMPSLEKEYNVVNQLYTIAKDYNITIDAEELALFQMLIPSFHTLRSTVLFCEAKRDENIIKFGTDLKKHLSNLCFELIDMRIKINNPILLQSETMPKAAKEIIQNLSEEVSVLSKKAQSYVNYQQHLGSSLSVKNFTEDLMSEKSQDSKSTAQAVNADLSEIEYELTLRKLLWEMKEEWAVLYSEWKDTPFDQLNVDKLQKDVNRFTQTIYMLEKGLPENDIVPNLKQGLLDFKLCLPIIVALRNPYLRSRHWDSIQYIIGRAINKDERFTLGNLLDLKVLQYKNKIGDISSCATNEFTLDSVLNKVTEMWKTIDFRLVKHQTDVSSVMIIASAEEITSLLEESKLTISTIKASRYAGPFKNQIEEWDRKLNLFAHTLDEWIMCQKKWLYLEQIFLPGDIQRQLPEEAQLFSQVDKVWKELMQKTENKSNALKATTAPGVLEMLQTNNVHLEKIQKSLEDYLEMKRMVFPRFYFLSNDDLFNVLAQSKNPNAIQPYLPKCFENINSLDVKDQSGSHPVVTLIRSAENEMLSLPKNIRARGPVEQWLGNVETAMFDTVKRHLKTGLTEWSTTEFKKWVLAHPSQIVLIVSQVMFNKDCQLCFGDGNPAKCMKKINQDLLDHLDELAELALEFLTFNQQTTLEALLTIYIHCRDVLMDLIKNNIIKAEDFEWKRQLRYEWNEQDSTCYVIQAHASFTYGFEYLGCTPRLVITPLTDRCWLTLTGALHLHLGGSPAGPAGTGKTETVKDLAKALGKQCIVFNCSESIDYKMMGKLFSGIIQSGAWCCFDEFNRIDVEVLSVIASQIQAIKVAKDNQVTRFTFEGHDVRLNNSCGVFITMNPGYKGRVDLPDNLKSFFRPVAMMMPDYGLIAEVILFSEGFKSAKRLSRKIVNLYQLASKQLSKQDHYDFGMRAIKSVLLMAGKKKESELSPMCHMPYRRIFTEEEESFILRSALQEANLPRFLAEDVPLFQSIMDDLFSNINLPKLDSERLEDAITASVLKLGLQLIPNQVQKIIQLHSQIMARHGVMLVGPSGGGKTTARTILQKALPLLLTPMPETSGENALQGTVNKKAKIDVFPINPKSITLGELYGQIDLNTMEWSDGLLSAALRNFSKELQMQSEARKALKNEEIRVDVSVPHIAQTSAIEGQRQPDLQIHDDVQSVAHKWIILDGPVDTLWVENLNSLLDDSKILCLANGERITLPAEVRIIFEVDNLSQASPATISRCAMVYMDPVDLGWMPYVNTWLAKECKELGESGQKYLQTLFNKSMAEGLDFIKKNQKMQHFPVPEMSIIMTLCNILGAFINVLSKNGCLSDVNENIPWTVQSRSSSSKTTSSFRGSLLGSAQDRRDHHKWFLQKHPDKLPVLLGRLFVFAFTWAVGGILNRDEEWEDSLQVSKDKDTPLVSVACCFDKLVHDLFDGEPPHGVRLPTGNRLIFGYFVDLQTGAFVPWDELVTSTESMIKKGLSFSSFSESLMYEGVKGKFLKKSMDSSVQFIPTPDTVRFSFLTSLLLLNNHPVLLTGESGVGKSVLIHNMLENLKKQGGHLIKPGTILGDVFLHNQAKSASLLENVNSLTAEDANGNEQVIEDAFLETALSDHSPGLSSKSFIKHQSLYGITRPSSDDSSLIVSSLQFCGQTSVQQTQARILKKLVRKGKGFFGASHNKKVLFFLDDLNMPVPEKYGAQPPLEFIRQFIELGGFYNAKDLVWKHVEDVTLLAACAPPSGGRNDISPRLLRLFSTIVVPQPSTQSLQHIFQVQLGGFLNSSDFMPEVQRCRIPLVTASIAVYYKMCHHMLPTPSKFHYVFNLRDLAKVIQGLQQADGSDIVSKEAVTRLFTHEVTRVFHDRLVCEKDKELFHQILSTELQNYFKLSTSTEIFLSESAVFGDFLDINSPSGSRIYKHISDEKKLTAFLEEYQLRSSFRYSKAPFVFFREAVEHIVRAARIFRQPGGHMMAIGLDGTGKITCISLACHISGCSLYRLAITKNYSYSDFREDIKKVFKQCGLHGANTVLLISDSDIVEETFLEDLSCILDAGEVPDLFDNEEIDNIALEIKSNVVDSNIPEKREEIYMYFLQQVRTRLHVVVCTSPAGTALRQRCRLYPSLLSCCTVDWYSEWTNSALLKVANTYINSMDLGENMKALRDSVAEVCVDIHKNVSSIAQQYWKEMRRRYYITPSSYLDLINTFSRMSLSEKMKIQSIRDRFFNGLSKLTEATDLIKEMQEEIVALGPKIEHKSKDIEFLMEKLQKDSEAVEQVRALVKMEEQTMGEETRIVKEYAEQATEELNAVLPSVQKAIAALDALDKADISEIRVYTSPPDLVLTVMNAVCTLLQKKPGWTTAKLLLADPGFLKKLVTIDIDSIPEKVFIKLRRYSKDPSFTPDKVGVVSTACRSLCLWVLAVENYHEVHKNVAPKQMKVEEAKEALKIAQKKLEEKQKMLQMIESHQLNLQQHYNESIWEKEELDRRKVLATQRLHRAAILTAALADEKVRWNESLSKLESKLQGIVGDVLLSAACITYFGAFTATYRKQMLQSWVNFCIQKAIPVTPEFTLSTAMAEEKQLRKWRSEGLPPDQNSIENAILIKKSSHWPLLIDPQEQAYEWICHMEGANLKKVSASDPNYMKTIETAVRLGQPVLIQDLQEKIDPILKPLLMKDVVARDGQSLIKMGDAEIEYNPDFRLYLTTHIPNPHILPAICIMVKLINFIVTFDGLQDQFLSRVISLENPQLEEQHCQLLESITLDLSLLQELEDKSLMLLQKTEGHILDDQDLIDTLQNLKITSKEIINRVQISENTEQKIEQTRVKYLPVANRAATLYFVVADLVELNYMYQFSLDWFSKMFIKAIQQVNMKQKDMPHADPLGPVAGTLRPQSAQKLRRPADNKMTAQVMKDLNSHISETINTLTENIYKEVSLALFGNHQLCFSFMICVSIMINDYNGSSLGFLPISEWQTFLYSDVLASMMDTTGDKNKDDSTFKRPPLPWLSESKWKQCQYIAAHVSTCSLLCESLISSQEQWRRFLETENTYQFLQMPYTDMMGSTVVPSDLEKPQIIFPWDKLSAFQKLILIKTLKPESLISSLEGFIADKLGTKYVESGNLTLREMYDNSDATTPLIFILSPGMDPTSQLMRLAQEVRGSTVHVDMVSLGRGQGPKAKELIKKAQILKGRWVFLQNCHLAASFMPQLQTIVNSFTTKSFDIDPLFRLWLCSRPESSFPLSVLQKGLKIAVEPPQGLKKRLLHTFSSCLGEVTEEMYAKTSTNPTWKRLLFGLCFFNAVLHERKKYGPLGWNIPYEFSSSDLEVALQSLEMLLEGAVDVPCQALRYLTGEVVYGGRVTDSWDRRCLLSTLDHFYHPSVLLDKQTFSKDTTYKPIPVTASLVDCRKHIESLPDHESPELYGMDHCAKDIYEENKAQLFVDTIISMQPRIQNSRFVSQQKQDEVILEMALDIINKVPKSVESEESTMHNSHSNVKLKDLMAGAQGFDPLVLHSPLLIVLRQEMTCFNRLLSALHSSLNSFCCAVKGEILMTEALEEVYSSFLAMRVPSLWKRWSYESCKPLLSWIEDLIQRVQFFRTWEQKVKSYIFQRIDEANLQQNEQIQKNPNDCSMYLPRSFWISGFFSPQGFLTAVLQNYARQNGLSMDSVSFTCQVMSSENNSHSEEGKADQSLTASAPKAPSPPEDGVLLFGLYLSGAQWDSVSQTLKELQPHQQHCPFPEIHFLPFQVSNENSSFALSGEGSKEMHYECPVYQTSKRTGNLSSTGLSTNFVTSLNLPTKAPATQWIRRGTALLCQLNE
ncbi:dynein axonemal heavy chain 6-like [Erpetoichthys calabaricus]|uniref:dynein axonemal heavy chain 6-like n=1 Tax=Erpetoichthys calabaricus TaxID=27687 RepID=UPI00223432CC|nr:dynein axonemal heavy chain 6-like [Erpetoichthys calabaricus]